MKNIEEYSKKISSFAQAKSDLLWALVFAVIAIGMFILHSPYWSLYILCFSLSSLLKHLNKWLFAELSLPLLAILVLGWGLYDFPIAYKIVGSATLSAAMIPFIISNYKKRKIKPATGNQ